MSYSQLKWTMLISLGLGGLGLLPACSSDSPNSQTNDIFKEDAGDANKGNARRHPADSAERLWTIDMKGCSGSLLSPEFMMTAAHCQFFPGQNFTSGFASGKGKSGDIAVDSIAERNETLDYAILKISWVKGYPTQQNFPPLVATKAADVARNKDDGQGDAVFTVGFPGDKVSTWGATYSEGNAKAFADDQLFYNIGIINGNSGGGVWRKSDHMLVSLTNGGIHALGETGWDTASSGSPDSWNTGPAMWVAYAASPVLKDIFPDGKNRFTKTATDNQDVFLAIGEPDAGAADTFTLFVSAPKTTAKVIFCAVAKVEDCNDNASGFTVAKLTSTLGGQNVFKAGRSTSLSNGLVLSMIATDAQGKTVATKSLKFSSK